MSAAPLLLGLSVGTFCVLASLLLLLLLCWCGRLRGQQLCFGCAGLAAVALVAAALSQVPAAAGGFAAKVPVYTPREVQLAAMATVMAAAAAGALAALAWQALLAPRQAALVAGGDD